MSYVPLIAPSTTDDRIRFLSSIADSFIYVSLSLFHSLFPKLKAHLLAFHQVVSKMGTTGATDSVNSALPKMLERIRSLLVKPHPLAVGFGVSTQAHFEEVGRDADGVVIGSQLVAVIKESSRLGTAACASAVEAYCASVSGNRTRKQPLPKREITDSEKAQPIVEEKAAKAARFGDFGGAYVPEALYDCLEELTTAYADARADPKFWKEWENEFGYMNRPSQLYEAKRLTEHCGGARIWFKREDLNHTGSHKVRLAHSYSVIVLLFEDLSIVDSTHRSTTLLDKSCSLEGSERNVSSLRLVLVNTVSLPLPSALNSVWSESSTFPTLSLPFFSLLC